MFDLFDEPQPPPRSRNRDRENAGKSAASYYKHRLLRKAVQGQATAFRIRHPYDRLLLIDGNAGDGKGVPEDQLDLFGENPSCATARLLVNLASQLGHTDVLLCEKDKIKQNALREQFPEAKIIGDHHAAPDFINGYSYVLWLSDPCGPASQGIEPMAVVARKVKSDFVSTFNEGFLNNVENTKSRWETSRDRYLPWRPPEWWLNKLRRRLMSRTPLIKASGRFHYRVLVVSNFLADAVKRKPFEEVVR